MKRTLALNDMGHLTYCTVDPHERGRNGCNHSMHKDMGESTNDFISRVNEYIENKSTTGLEPIVTNKVESLIKKERMLIDLNNRLKEIGEDVDMIAAGGFSLQTYGLRSTIDVDAFFNSSNKIDGVIREIGEKEGINMEEELWLNNNIMNMNETPGPEHTELTLDMSHLKVRRVRAEYMFIMKLSTDRSRDIDDCVDMLKTGIIDIKTMKDFRVLCEDNGVNYSVHKDRAIETMTDAFFFCWSVICSHSNASYNSYLDID